MTRVASDFHIRHQYTESLVSSLQGFLDVVTQNRLQLFPADEEQSEQDKGKSETENTIPEVSKATEEPEITNISLSDDEPEE